jgi:hypothetical protein
LHFIDFTKKGIIMKKVLQRLITGMFYFMVVIFSLNCAGEKKGPFKSEPRVDFSLEIARVWSGQHVGFFLETSGNHQAVAYYDEERRMTVAIRTLDSFEWDYYAIPDTPDLGWSSHKDIALEFDDDGYLHVSGNMHGTPMIYFISTKPYDIHSLKRVDLLVDSKNEKKVTYPQFVRGANGEFIFHYRDGSSGKGNEIYNVYDEDTKSWSRLLDTPMIDGEGKRNAYYILQRLSDGYFHLSYGWRDTPDVITANILCYVRSKDMIKWETVDGQPIQLPITFATNDVPGVVVDPIPINSGFGGGGQCIDSKGRMIITFGKFDKDGNNQIYNARWEKGKWKIVQTSDWTHRWYFHGFGAIQPKIWTYGVELRSDGYLTQNWKHWEHGLGTWILDEKTLRPTSTAPMELWPEECLILEDHTGEMEINWKKDAGDSKDSDTQYYLRWESYPVNRDRPREEAPHPSNLKLYGLKYGS